MPIEKCTTEGKAGVKYSKGGKCYTGPTAKTKAKKQGQAIEISRHANTPAKKAAEKEWRREHKKD